MHGSFVVAQNAVEQLTTFDHGAEGSITEDAYFALVAREMGVRYAWIDTHMYEQSPFRCAPPPPAPFSSLNERTEFSSSKSSSSKSSIDLLNRWIA
eukprot:1179955-Prorocentrum_minimum.AAC.3